MDTGIDGLKVVHVQHFRFQKSDGNVFTPNRLHSSKDISGWADLSPTGGYTVVVVRNEETGKHHIGIARCHLDEPFVRKQGLEVGLAWAIKAASENTKIAYHAYPRRHKSAWLCIYKILRLLPMYLLVDEPSLKGLRV